MKIRFLMSAFLGLTAMSALAQKGELNSAQSAYEKYDGLARANYNMAKPSLMEAKTSIDKASTNAKTATLAQTYALKGAIYASLAYHDTDPATAATESTTASEAIAKAKETDTKNEYKNLIDHASRELAQIQMDKGVKAYQDKKFDEAYTAFDAAQKILPTDTTAILYTGVSAANAKNYTGAIANYNKLLTTEYKGKAAIYGDLPSLYLANKDTAGAIKSISDAVAKYPNDPNLRREEIEVNLQAGQQGDLVTKIDAAIKADPNNKALYYYSGLTYSQIAESQQKNILKLQKADKAAAAKAKPGTKMTPNPQIEKLEQTRLDNFNKAAEQYKKAVTIDPNYFEAVLNLGYVTMAPGIDTYNSAQFVNDQKTYDALMNKANSEFAAAKPYLLKAVELNPQSRDALTNLKSYYLGTKDMNGANDTQKKIDALPAAKQ